MNLSEMARLHIPLENYWRNSRIDRWLNVQIHDIAMEILVNE